MQRLTVTLPDGVYTQLKRLAKAEGMPIKQYVACEITRHIELVEAGIPAINELIEQPNGTPEPKELDAA